MFKITKICLAALTVTALLLMVCNLADKTFMGYTFGFYCFSIFSVLYFNTKKLKKVANR